MIQVCQECASIIRSHRPEWIEVECGDKRIKEIFKTSTDSCCACLRRTWPNEDYSKPAAFFEGPAKTRIREKAVELIRSIVGKQ
jgi:hypothetical protein